MPKGQQKSNKQDKKPKKNTAPPKEVSSDRPVPPPMTAVIPKGKVKKLGT